MRPVHDVATVRAAEKKVMATLPAGALMQRAATALARRCASLLPRVYGSHVVLLVGKGNNGGDTLYAGARLAARGARVDALLVGAANPEAALVAFVDAGGRTYPADVADEAARVAKADLVVDGLVGIGGKGALRGSAATLAAAAADGDGLVVAVDVPSGVDASTGRVAGAAVRADVTVTFGVLKPGLIVAPGAAYAGQVECVDIGLGPHLPQPMFAVPDADDIAALTAEPDLVVEIDKYRRGVVGVVAGSEAYPGAAALATGGAVVAGAGMVRFVSTEQPARLVNIRCPEAVVTVIKPGDGSAVVEAGRVQAWVVGPGLGTGAEAAAVIEAVLGTDVPVLVDADGLSVIAENREWLRRSAPTLLTPHAGEFGRLTGAERADVEADRLERVRAASTDLGAVILLKGSTTLVADPAGRVVTNPTGTRRLGTAGSGDVLSGACGALLARGLPAFEAGVAGAFLHGLAGRLAGVAGAPISAGDIITAWPAAVAAVRGGAPTS